MQGKLPTLVKKTVNSFDPAARVILFGSRARGDSSNDSDWDFLILTPKKLNTKYKDQLRQSLYWVELSEDEVISSIIENAEIWKKYIHSNFYQNVSKEGVEILLANSTE
ncbi:MAG: nucleotidyltransferase domain-containing protein [Bacteroidota bacterium]